MTLIKVPLEKVKEEIRNREKEALSKLTSADRDFISKNFRKEKAFMSETFLLQMFPFGDKEKIKQGKKLVKLGVAHYSAHVFTIVIDELVNLVK